MLGILKYFMLLVFVVVGLLFATLIYQYERKQ